MPRIGINPARGKTSSYQPAPVTVALVTYIPGLGGYFQQKLDVLRLAINSILANTSVPYDLMVLDNGSCDEVVDYLLALRDAEQIDYLLLSSKNLGKIGAFQVLFKAAPGEIIAYADDDVFFYPGWLEAHLAILEAYPEVGMVSGDPVRHASDRSSKSLDQLLKNPPPSLDVRRERRFPDQWDKDWAISTGRDPEEHLETLRDHEDLILRLNGIEAFGSASHFQFVSPKSVLIEALPEGWSGKLMGQMNELDEAVDQLGCLRLATVDRYTRHLGNALSEDVLEEVKALQVDLELDEHKQPLQRSWLLRIPGAGRVLRWVYNFAFDQLNRTR